MLSHCAGTLISHPTHSGVTRDSGAPRQIFKSGPPFLIIFFIIHTIQHDIRVEFKFKLKFIGVCCCNAATKHSMVWIVMRTFYCNYFFCLELGGPLHSWATLDFAYPIVTPLPTHVPEWWWWMKADMALPVTCKDACIFSVFCYCQLYNCVVLDVHM